jgi:hypothetical protein
VQPDLFIAWEGMFFGKKVKQNISEGNNTQTQSQEGIAAELPQTKTGSHQIGSKKETQKQDIRQSLVFLQDVLYSFLID